MDKLIGTWNLLSWEFRNSDGSTYYPMGKDCLGQIIYTREGLMSVHLMKKERKPFINNGLFDGKTDEKASIADSFIAYAGKFSISENIVTHDIKLCSFPNWIGTKQKRFFELKGNNQLILSTPPLQVKNNEFETAYLIWERM